MVDLDYQKYIDRIDGWIVERSRTVMLVFLVLTVVFAIGATGVSTESGTSSFTEDNPAQEALDSVNQEFTPPFETDNGTTQLIQTAPNVLSKTQLLYMLEAQERLTERPSLEVVETSSAAQIVAQTIDPNATTLDAQIDTIEEATPSEIEAAVGQAAETPGFSSLLTKDFNPESGSASGTLATVSHDVEVGDSAGQGGDSPLTPIQQRSQQVVSSVGGDITVFGSGITSAELGNVIGDSLLIVTPAAVVLILVFLVFSYRDPIDLLLGVVALLMAIIWTFGFMGIAGIPFSQLLIAVPPLLLAVGIDFGIHAINRYREERIQGRDINPSMRTATDQLLIAFFIVTGTTVFGFGSNIISDLQPTRQFGIVAAIGITFTFLIFGIFLPAAKVWADRLRDQYNVPEFGTTPLGGEGSVVGRVLTVGVTLARKAPYAVLVVALLVTIGGGYLATGVDSSFSNEDFLPPEDNPDYIEALPEPFAPSEYTVSETTNYLDDNFASGEEDTVTIYVQGPLRQDNALEQIQRANQDPPDAFVGGREAQGESVLTVIDGYAEQSPEFRRLVDRNDVDDDGVPDDNLGRIYEALLSSPVRDQALNYISEDYRSTRIVYSVESSASQQEVTNDARELASRFRFTATATGGTVVFQAVSDIILASAIQSLIAALIATAIFLVLIYWVIEGRPSLGIVNLVPIVVGVALLGGTMNLIDIPFNALTATILSISIGLGIDYAAHFVHRFADEYHEFGEQVYPALEETIKGTGGALAGSMLTTTTGTGVLALAITPILGQFGLLIALSVLYSFIASILVAPSVIVVWDRFTSVESDGLRRVLPGNEPRTADD